MTETGKVEEIRQKQTSGGLLYILKIDGQKMSFFADSEVELGEIEEGDIVEFKTVKNGDYTNLTEIGLVEKGHPTGESKESDMKKGVALKAAAQVTNSPEKTREVAKEFYQLLEEGGWDE